MADREENTVDPSKIPDPYRPTLMSFFLVEIWQYIFAVLALYLIIFRIIVPICVRLWEVLGELFEYLSEWL